MTFRASSSRSPTLLTATAVAASVTGTTSETTLATFTVPAGAMGLNGGLLIKAIWSMTNSANAKTLQIRLGGIGGTVISTHNFSSNAGTYVEAMTRNRGAANSQMGTSVMIASNNNTTLSNSVKLAAVDSTQSISVVITGTLVLGTETLTLEGFEAWLLP